MATQAQITAVQQLYVSYLGRAADSAGLAFWSNAISTGTATVASVATGLTLATEYKTAYAGLTNDALVDKVYTNVLGRPADAAGKAFWVASFANGSVKADTFVSSLISSLGTQDQQTINNKTFVAQTYTDTAGTAYSPVAATAVLVGVNSTVASVNTAIANITNGTLTGLVPGLNAIATLNAAKDAEVAFGKEIATANPTYDLGTTKDGVVTKAELNTATTGALAVETAARDLASAGGDVAGTPKTTAVLIGESATANANVATAKTAITSTTAGTKAVADYEAALTAQVAVQGTAADQLAVTASKNAAISGLDTSYTNTNALWATLNGKTLAASDITNATTLYNVLANKDLLTSERTALVAEVNKLGSFGAQLLAAADKAVAVAKAADVVATAKLAVTAASSSTKSDTYTDAVGVAKTATELLTKTQAADAKVAAVQALVDKYTALEDVTLKAGNAVSALNTDKVALVDLGGKTSGDAAVAANAVKSDVFYFGTKIAATTVSEVTSFGVGDSIVVGSSVAYNSGALSTGNSNALEFFLVKSATGTQVVIESKAFGNASTVVGTDGTVGVHPEAAVITLTGVTADHLSVANGVISYV